MVEWMVVWKVAPMATMTAVKLVSLTVVELVGHLEPSMVAQWAACWVVALAALSGRDLVVWKAVTKAGASAALTVGVKAALMAAVLACWLVACSASLWVTKTVDQLDGARAATKAGAMADVTVVMLGGK